MYKRQAQNRYDKIWVGALIVALLALTVNYLLLALEDYFTCLLYTSDAADERSSVDLGGRRIIKKKNSERL